MNGSGKFPNDFIGRSVRCARHGCEGGGGRRREHVHARARRGVRDPHGPAPVDELVLLDIDPERLAVVGALAERMMRRAGCAGHVAPDRRSRDEAHRGRRLRDRAAARRRAGRPLPRRDDPARGSAASARRRPGRAGSRRRCGRFRSCSSSPSSPRDDRRARRVVRRLHEPDRPGHPGAARRGSPGARSVQRGDRLPATVRRALRRGARARAAGARRAEPPDVGAQGAGGRRRSPARAARHRDRPGGRRDRHARRAHPGRSARSLSYYLHYYYLTRARAGGAAVRAARAPRR